MSLLLAPTCPASRSCRWCGRCGRVALAGTLAVAFAIGSGPVSGTHAASIAGGPFAVPGALVSPAGCVTTTALAHGHHRNGTVDPAVVVRVTVTGCPASPAQSVALRTYLRTHPHSSRAAVILHQSLTRSAQGRCPAPLSVGEAHPTYVYQGTVPVGPCNPGHGAFLNTAISNGYHAFAQFDYQVSSNGSNGYTDAPDYGCTNPQGCSYTFSVGGVPGAAYYQIEGYASANGGFGFGGKGCLTLPRDRREA